MLSIATISLLAMATVMAILVGVASRALLRPAGSSPSHRSLRGPILRLIASMLVAGAALALFVEVADNVLDQDELARFDGYVMSAFQPVRTAFGLTVARTVSALGTFPFMTLLALAVVLTVYRRRWHVVLLGWILVVGGGQIVEQILKHTFHRTRPPGAVRYLAMTSFSYPSGHAMGAMIGYGVLAYLLLLGVWRRPARVAVTAIAALIILSVGTSRLVLGVHYFTDVVGGFAAGAVWLALSIAIMETERWRLAGGTSRAPLPSGDGIQLDT
jgi:undecaprenyl-diphosphatase